MFIKLIRTKIQRGQSLWNNTISFRIFTDCACVIISMIKVTWSHKMISSLTRGFIRNFSNVLCGWAFAFYQLLHLSFLVWHHALFEVLNLCLAFPPVFILHYALLNCIMECRAACLGDQPIYQVIFFLGFALVMGQGWRMRCHSALNLGWK